MNSNFTSLKMIRVLIFTRLKMIRVLNDTVLIITRLKMIRVYFTSMSTNFTRLNDTSSNFY